MTGRLPGGERRLACGSEVASRLRVRLDGGPQVRLEGGLPPTPEQEARVAIDKALVACGWLVQGVDEVNVTAGRGVAIREFPLAPGHGHADYALFVDGKAAGIIEAKKAGVALTGVEVQAEKYSTGLPDQLPAYRRPLPFIYQSTGVETRFTNLLDPDPRSRRVFSFHRPETFAEWLWA